MNTKLTRALAAALSAVAMFAFAQDAETVKVRGKGVGADKTEALKDAYRDAVERAVGLYVDAEQMMKNEELVKDQILTQSNAYIEKYDVAKETTNPNGLVEIQILAEVRKAALTKKISDVMPTKQYKLSDGLKDTHAKITTVEKRNVDGRALLEKTLAEIGNPHLKCIDCSLASPEAVVGKIDERRDDADRDKVLVNYLFKLKIDPQRFVDNVSTPLREVLDQISVSEPEEMSLSATVKSSCNVADALAAARRAAEGEVAAKKEVGRLVHGQYDDVISVKLPQAGANVSRRAVSVLLVTGANKYGTVYTARKYELDEACSKLMRDWYVRMNNIYQASANINVVLLDAEGEAIFTHKIAAYSGIDGRQIGNSVVIAPWLGNSFYKRSGGVALCNYSWERICLPKSVLPEVSDMKIEIVK